MFPPVKDIQRPALKEKTIMSPDDKPKQYISGTFKIPIFDLMLNRPLLEWSFAESWFRLRTMPAIPPHLPCTKGLSEERIYDIYAEYVEKYGNQLAKDALKNGEQVIVGLRIETNVRANRGRGIYDDRLAIIRQEKPKQQAVARHGCTPYRKPASFIKRGADFTANTEPSAFYEEPVMQVKQIKSKKTGKMIQVKVADKIIGPDGQEIISHPKKKWDGQDVNKDGRRDLGRLIPGTYKFYNNGQLFHNAAHLRGLGMQSVERDVNHDGAFTQDDVWHTDKGDTIIQTSDNLGILFHIGNKDSTGTGSSACQSLPPIEHARFFNTLKRQHLYYYVLVTLK